MFRNLIVALLSCCFIVIAPCALAAPAKQDKGNPVAGQGTRRHLTTIVFAGLAGAILGLSTLSFYGRPQDRLSNIAVGFAIGVISGTMYTTYKAATEPRDFYSAREANAELWSVASAPRKDSFALLKYAIPFP